MNTLTSSTLDTPIATSVNSEQLATELSDKSSVWYDLKVAEMSGYDYVFAPDAICRQFNNLNALSGFLTNIRTILGSMHSQTILISYWHDHCKELHFEKYDLKWGGNTALDWKKDLLDGTPQVDFIHTLYNHSEALIFDA